MTRAALIVMDSVGIGGAPDGARYGDDGADTVGHIAEACAAGRADRGALREGPLRLPNLRAMGLGEACRLATGRVPPGLDGFDGAGNRPDVGKHAARDLGADRRNGTVG